MKSVKFLVMVKDRYNLKNDTDLATQLGVSKAAVSQWMKGARVMENEICLALALALEINPIEILRAADIDRAEKAGTTSLWEEVSKNKELLTKDVKEIDADYMVERRRIELPTFALRTRRSPS